MFAINLGLPDSAALQEVLLCIHLLDLPELTQAVL